MKRDPKPNPDGTCARKGCAKKLPALAVEAGDPFCSGRCCRTHHAVVLSFEERDEPSPQGGGIRKKPVAPRAPRENLTPRERREQSLAKKRIRERARYAAKRKAAA